MFARMAVPCAAVAENMSYFDGNDGTRYHPFGQGSGDRIMRDFGLPHLIRFPILPELSAAGDGATTLVPYVLPLNVMKLLQYLYTYRPGGWAKAVRRSPASSCKTLGICWLCSGIYTLKTCCSQYGPTVLQFSSGTSPKRKERLPYACMRGLGGSASVYYSCRMHSMWTGGKPLVVADPASQTSQVFMELGACVVREVAKLQRLERNTVRYACTVYVHAV